MPKCSAIPKVVVLCNGRTVSAHLMGMCQCGCNAVVLRSADLKHRKVCVGQLRNAPVNKRTYGAAA